MLPLYKMGNTEDPFLKSMIPGGLMYPDNLIVWPQSREANMRGGDSSEHRF